MQKHTKMAIWNHACIKARQGESDIATIFQVVLNKNVIFLLMVFVVVWLTMGRQNNLLRYVDCAHRRFTWINQLLQLGLLFPRCHRGKSSYLQPKMCTRCHAPVIYITMSHNGRSDRTLYTQFIYAVHVLIMIHS